MGGGGRGLRVVRGGEDLLAHMESAQREALSAFGDGEVFLEKYIEGPHHIEFQILADKHGHVIHLGERDCSIQRRHQKLIEIAPSLVLTKELRAQMGEAAIAIAKAVNYDNAGTVEFLLDRDRRYYFIEMNTRIQVEHTITEQITAIDLVRAQITIAAGQPLEICQEDVILQGHAIQCRINAEDPRNQFRPCTGTVTAYYSPGGIGVGLMARSTRITHCHRITTPCSLSLWSGAERGKKRSAERTVRLRSTCYEALRRRSLS